MSIRYATTATMMTALTLAAACAATPTPPAATAQPSPTATQTPEPTATPSQEMGDLRITIVYDNTTYDTRLKAAWGFAALIEYGGRTLLFDTGGDAPTLLGNMELLGIDPAGIEIVALSHIHGDHVGGLDGLLQTGARPVVYAPPSFPADFKRQVEALTELVEVEPGQEIAGGIFTTGEMFGMGIAEQALMIPTEGGLVVITGCAHPGIVNIVERAKELFGGPVRLVMGGFHLGSMSAGGIETILADFRRLGVQQVSPVHCTGEKAIAMFAQEYGDDYIQGGAGRVCWTTSLSNACGALSNTRTST